MYLRSFVTLKVWFLGGSMSAYPDWVLKHKPKGTYVNYQNGKYYLYAAHSERIPGTDKVRRVSDGYIGRITEEGLIPAKKKLGAPVYAYEYGLSFTILLLCENIQTGLKHKYRKYNNYVMAAGMLLFMYGEIRQEYYESSWVSKYLPGLDMTRTPSEDQQVGVERVQRMIAETLRRHFKESYQEAVSLLPLVKVVCMGSEAKIAEVPEGVKEFLELHQISFKEVQYG